MTAAQDGTPVRLVDLADKEAVLLGRIRDASDDLQRAEDLDEEQLAEIHAILQALRHDGESNATLVRLLAKKLGHGAADA